MARSTTKELTSGSPMKLILGFAVPLLFGMLFQQFYSLMDTIIVGRYLGVTALAAVGATGSINFLIIGFCQGICNGFGLPVAQRVGSHRRCSHGTDRHFLSADSGADADTFRYYRPVL